MHVRLAVHGDAKQLEHLLREMIQESYPAHRGATAAELQRDVLSGSVGHRVLIAERECELHGFVSWDMIYDMHWAARGAQIADLYVRPARRGFGLAIALLASCCAEVQRVGGRFIRGGACDEPSVRRLYARFAIVGPNGDSHCSGRAFQHMASLQSARMRSLVKALPNPAWNFED